MAWTEITRRHYRRDTLRYASDLTNAEWALISPFMPIASKVGRPRKTDLRSVVEAILFMASTGCQWRALPKDFQPYSTVQGYFYGKRGKTPGTHLQHCDVGQNRVVVNAELSVIGVSGRGIFPKSCPDFCSSYQFRAKARGPQFHAWRGGFMLFSA